MGLENKNVSLGDTQFAVYELLNRDSFLEIKELAYRVGKSERTVSRALDYLKEHGFIRREKGKSKGFWTVLK